mgnify:CR=1 FL=1
MLFFRYSSTGGKRPQIRLAVEARLPEIDFRGVEAFLRQLGKNFVVYYQECWRTGVHPTRGQQKPSKHAIAARRAAIYGWGEGVVRPKLRARAGKNVILGKLQPQASYTVEIDNPAYYASGLMAHSLRGYYRSARQYRKKDGTIVDVAARVEFGVDPQRTVPAKLAGLEPQAADMIASRLASQPDVSAEMSGTVFWDSVGRSVGVLSRAAQLVSAAAGLVA